MIKAYRNSFKIGLILQVFSLKEFVFLYDPLKVRFSIIKLSIYSLTDGILSSKSINFFYIKCEMW